MSKAAIFKQAVDICGDTLISGNLQLGTITDVEQKVIDVSNGIIPYITYVGDELVVTKNMDLGTNDLTCNFMRPVGSEYGLSQDFNVSYLGFQNGGHHIDSFHANGIGRPLFINFYAESNIILGSHVNNSSTTINGNLNITETTGTPATATGGSITLSHLNNGGTSSIVFKSKIDVNSDFGYISYRDNDGGSSTQNSLLEIGVQNDGVGDNVDNIALMPSGYVGVNTITPQAMLDVSGDIICNGNVDICGGSLTIAGTMTSNTPWALLGQTINGDSDGDYSGWSVSINAKGDIVAIGAPYDDSSGNNRSGSTKMYQYTNGTWVQLGQTINGDSDGDYSGWSVSINAKGDIVAIGAPYDDSSGNNRSGSTKMYQYTNGTWVQLGQTINGDSNGDYSGSSVSINAKGDIVAIGAILDDNSFTDSGSTKMYQYTNGLWNQLGQTIDGDSADDQSGWSVSINAKGDIVAIGAPYDNNFSNSGLTKIYQYTDGSWNQLGQTIYGDSADGESGYSVSINAKGDIVAIGAPYDDNSGNNNSGSTKMYQYTNGLWNQLGQTIYGDSADDQSGYSVSINTKGDIVAIGAIYDDNSGNNNSGSTKMYQYTNGLWNQSGQTIYGDSADGESGTSVSINAKGDIVAIGAPYDNNFSNLGSTKIYQKGLRGNVTIEDDLSVRGDLIVNGGIYTDNFSVADTTGHTTIGGDIICNGNFQLGTISDVEQKIIDISYISYDSDNDKIVVEKDMDLSINNLTFNKGVIQEVIGTTPSASGGSLTLKHDDTGGTSSIVFKSKKDTYTDRGYISYTDDISGNSGSERSLLEIGCGNDDVGGHVDNIALMPSGYVGINTRTPQAMLDVSGNLLVTGTVTAPGGFIGNAATATTAGSCTGNAATATTAGTCTGNASSATKLETSRTIAGQTFDGQQNVSIASTDLTDTSTLVRNNADQTISGVLTANSFVGSGATLTNIPNGALVNSSIYINNQPVSLGSNMNLTESQWTTDASGIFYGSGNVGIGTLVPVYSLDVSGIINAPTVIGDLSGNAATATTAGTCTGNAATATTAGTCTGNASSATKLETSRTIAGQTFDGQQNVSIASTDLTDTSTLVRNNADQTISGVLTANSFVGSGATLTNIPNGALVNSSIYINNQPVSLGSNMNLTESQWTTDASGIFYGSGNVRIDTNSGQLTATSFNATSDLTLKSNISMLNTPLEKILNIEGRNYTWKNDENNVLQSGLIAQQVEEHIPEVIVTNKENNIKTINYNGIIPYLVESIKEQQRQIESQKSEIEELKTMVKTLIKK